MKKWILLTLFLVPSVCFGQGFNKEDFLNAVINDFVDSTWPVFYLKREAPITKIPRFEFVVNDSLGWVHDSIFMAVRGYNKRLLGAQDSLNKFYNSIIFEPIDSRTIWDARRIHRARFPKSDEEHRIKIGYRSSPETSWSSHQVHSERDDGTVVADGFLRFHDADTLTSKAYGSKLYYFYQPLFDEGHNYAVIRSIVYWRYNQRASYSFYHMEFGKWIKIKILYEEFDNHCR